MSFLHLLIPLKHRFYFVTSPLKSSQCLPLPRERSPNPQHRGTLAQDPLRLFAHCSFPLWPAVITCISLLTSRCQTVAIFFISQAFSFLNTFTCTVPSASNAFIPVPHPNQHSLHILQHQLQYSFLQETISTPPNKTSPSFQSTPKVYLPITVALVFIYHCNCITCLVFYEIIKPLEVEMELHTQSDK